MSAWSASRLNAERVVLRARLILISVRFSAGVYAGRVFALITSSIVLGVLLAETTRLYMRLARSNAMLRRERDNKLMNLEAMAASIAHEMRQPLTAIEVNAGAASLLLRRSPLDLEVVQSARVIGVQFLHSIRQEVADLLLFSSSRL
jgi:signal transduction histidine kinase